MLRTRILLAGLTLALPAAAPALAQPAGPVPRHATPAEDVAFTAWVAANATPISAAGPTEADVAAWFDRQAIGPDAQTAEFILAHDAARAAVDGLSIFEHGLDPPEGMNRAEYYGRRDGAMARIALRMQQRTGKGAVTWAHDLHVIDRLDPAFAAMSGYRSLGMELEDALGAGYRSIGFNYTDAIVRTTPARTGQQLAQVRVNDQLVPLPNSGPDTVGALFAAALPGRQAAWIDMDRLRAGPALAGFRTAWKFWPAEGWLVFADNWQKDFAGTAFIWTPGFDMVVWHRQATPQRRWPDLPRQPDLPTDD